VKQASSTPTSSSRLILKSLSLNVLVNLLLYLGHLIIARRLPRADYATFTVIVSFVSLMALFADLGLTSLFIRKFAAAQARIAEGNADERGELLGSMLAFRVGMAIIVSIVAVILAQLLGYVESTRHLMLIMLITLFISSRLVVVRSVGEAFLRGHNKYHLVALFTAIDALVFTGVLYFYSGKSLDLEGAVWIYSFCHVPGFLLLFGLIYKYGKSVGFKLQVSVKTIRLMLIEGFPLILGTAFLTIHSQADALLIDKLSTPNEVSAFGAGLRILSAIIFVPAVFSAVIGPVVTHATVTGEFARIRVTLDRYFRLLLVSALFVAVSLSISSDFVVNFLFGTNKYSDAIPLVILFGWTFIPICFGAFITDIAVAEGRFWISTLHTSILMLVSLCCDLIFIPRYGAYGAGMAKCISVSIAAMVLFFISGRLQVLIRRQILLLLLKLGAVSLCCLITIHFLPILHMKPLAEISVVMFIFFLCTFFLFRIISIREVTMFISGFFNKSKLTEA
jgi:O-antigen/teichoic acid export membrane protein